MQAYDLSSIVAWKDILTASDCTHIWQVWPIDGAFKIGIDVRLLHKQKESLVW
jgi:hypothetical protein